MFPKYKELGSWFGKLLPITSSMDNFRSQQAIEPRRKAPKTNGEGANPKKAAMLIFPKMGHQMEKRNPYLHHRIEKNLEDKLRVS